MSQDPALKPQKPSQFISFDFDKMTGAERYRIMIGAIVPRPIAFISTISQAGVGNLAPFSFFNGVCSDPPCLVVSITRNSGGGKKDTLRNIEETRGFVVNTVSEWMVEQMNQTSAAYPYGVDEMLKVGLTPQPSMKIKAARVQEAAIQLECELQQLVEVGTGLGSATLVIGRIVHAHVREDVYQGRHIDIHALKPVARLAGATYSKLGEVFAIERPTASV